MATIVINIADSDLNRVITDICGYFNYQATILDQNQNPIPNPETPSQFARRMVITSVKAWIANYESNQASMAASTAAQSIGIS